MRTFVGFGFGAIQGGLFLYEAHRSGNFGRLAVAEVLPDVVAAVRKNGGRYRLNIATRTGVESREIGGVDMLNPAVREDRERLVAAVAEASEMATALPSVAFYGSGGEGDVAALLAAGLARKAAAGGPPALVYTAENDNRAAEILEERLAATGIAAPVQCLNTVIGKMSGVVSGAAAMAEQKLSPIAPGLERAFLVEEFCRILITRVTLPDFDRGISVFEEKTDLLPFEEAKLYGHNAAHALIGYLLRLKSRPFMADAAREPGLLAFAREAFLEESGRALRRKHAGVDPLFTDEGFRAHVDNLLDRMMNPFLRDTVDRVTRDSRRKLGWNDRLVGTMRMALEQRVTPARYARGAAAALRVLTSEERRPADVLIEEAWAGAPAAARERKRVRDLIAKADGALDGEPVLKGGAS